MISGWAAKQDDRQAEEPANQAEEARLWSVLCWLTSFVLAPPNTHQTELLRLPPQPPSPARHSEIKCASLFQLLNSRPEPDCSSLRGATAFHSRYGENRTAREGLHANVTQSFRQHPLTPCKNFIPGLSPWQQELPGDGLANPARPSR